MKISKFENLKLKECKNIALRCCSGKVFFFDENLVWKSMDIETAFETGIKGVNKRTSDGSLFCNMHYEDLFGSYSDENNYRIDYGLAKKILSKLQEGDHISKVIDISNVTDIKYISGEEKRATQNLNEVERFVMSIEKPNIYRDVENENKNTFDFVEVIVNISVYHKNKVEFARKHKKEIAQMVLQKIENDRKFKKYGVPVTVLCLKNVMLSKNDFIRYLFEVKTA